ncbi:MAG: hypothetical protein ABJN04_13395 [Hyphomicrobiales bacterium]
MIKCIVLITSFLVMAFPNSVTAAVIQKSNDGLCVIEIVGEIKQGDFQSFVNESKRLFPGHDGESSRRDIVCLNSHGGSLAEGVLFSRYFTKNGVATVIRADEDCYSICAVMFMMGSVTGEGEVSTGISRKLHVKGTLGFHRPYLPINADFNINVRALTIIYNEGFNSAVDLIALANQLSTWSHEPRMKPDLVEKMLSHVGNDFFVIDNVDKAGRWDITLFGFEPPKMSLIERAFYSCENTLQWKVGTTNSNTALEFLLLNRRRHFFKTETTPQGDKVISIRGLDTGYVEEWCLMREQKEFLAGCGVDQNTSVSMGSNECNLNTSIEHYEYVSDLSQISAWTTLKQLALMSENSLPPFQPAKCYVLEGENTADEEVCFAILNRELFPSVTSVDFTWPSGAKTNIEVSGNNEYINGNRAESKHKEGFSQCFDNSATGKTFCYKAAM